MIYVSTGNFKNLTAPEAIRLFKKNNITNIELSGGKHFSNPQIKIRKLNKNLNLQVHNYFPPPKNPFVLNLCSENKYISLQSINLIKKNIRLTSKLKKKYYSFHAGFLIDLKYSDLGKSKKKIKLQNRQKGIKTFLKNINLISRYAKKNNVEILLENNVIGKSNYRLFRENPFLMSSVNEIYNIMKNTPNNVNLLLDIGHLKVSSKTLGFEKVDIFKKCEKWIKAFHISDNDGLEDTNGKIKLNSWFAKYLSKVDY